ncbi:MAG: glucose-6-phosphate isomerase [Polyangiaceae bacterium]|nr:glucose-6-phosphate isomerase [Polyangiaceae bacterium]
MTSNAALRWQRLQRLSYHHPGLGLTVDVSGMGSPPEEYAPLAAPLARAFAHMAELERGAVANPDEGRRVGHYWLRAPELAPEPELGAAVRQAVADVKAFARDVHAGAVRVGGRGEAGEPFERVLVVGIGGSALGGQLLAGALGGAADPLPLHFVDNTDPDGIDRLTAALGDGLGRALVVVISKSGGTKETRNGMLEIGAALEARGSSLARHAVAVTQDGSELDRLARGAGWLARFPMWDWVGGRTSVTSAVGLLPAALAGFDVDGLLSGARTMDEATRAPALAQNPAALLAAAWYLAGEGKGRRDMVVLPYKDRLELFGRYLQQLVMESVGKELDLDGRPAPQGLSVFGNKGSTDQHAYVQQLRDGLDNYFATFIEVLEDRAAGRPRFDVEPGVTSGDYLSGFLHGTRQALSERGRRHMLLTLAALDAARLGALVALYERAVGLYASLVHVNAYHQPGVEAGKRAAGAILGLQQKLRAALAADPGRPATAEELAARLGTDDVETVWRVLRHLAADPGSRVVSELSVAHAGEPWLARYRAAG